jgi:predicted enzyme related to lactoylglutathione lyase
MPTMDKPIAGTVTWVDLQTPDLEGARRFYGALLGWSFTGGDDPNTAFYVMAQLDGRNVCGMAKLGPQSKFPPMWSVYLATDDADATANRVAEAGGTVVVPPMEVMDLGRMAYFADPTGAYFGVWQARKHTGAQIVDKPGAMTWHEVYTRDIGKARAFYARVFGLEGKRLDAAEVEYFSLHKGDRTVGGAMQITPSMPKDEPSHWNTYFAVTDVDAAAPKVAQLGGRVFAPPFDTPYGRMTAVTDPFGASFCLIQPTQLV